MISHFLDYLKFNGTPGEYGSALWATIYILVIFAIASVAVMLMTYLERKVLAHMQIRLGPMRVGPHGLLQPIADALKLLIKEDIVPDGADKFLFWMAPVTVMMTAFTTYLVIPFGRSHAVTDMNIGVLFMIGISSLGVLAVVMAGWSSNSKYALMGGLRSAAQMVSYEVAMGLAIVSVLMMTSLQTGTGTLSMIGIVEAQQQQGSWFLFKFFPVGLVAFVIFAIAMVAETNRAPFDLPEAESELTAGFHTEYSGFRWSLFFLGEYVAMIAVSSIAVTLWLGGWLRPFPNALSGATWDLAFSCFPGALFFVLALGCFIGVSRMPETQAWKIQRVGFTVFGALLGLVGLVLLIPAVRVRVSDIFWFSAKVGFFMYLYIWYRGTFPRYRFDQLMKIGWKVLLPVSLAVVIVTAVLGVRHELLAGLMGVGR